MRKSLVYVIFLLSALALLFALPATASSEIGGTCGTEAIWNFNTETGELVVSGSGAIVDYDSADATPWSAYKTQIKSITVQEGITSIGAYAFSGTYAETVWMADTVTYLEHHGFSGCEKLKSVKFSQSLANAKNYVFSGCDLLDNVVLPSTFSSSSTGMFLNCTSLKSLTIEEGVKKVGNNFFAGCKSLVEVTLPSTLESLGNSYSVFKGCSALTKLVFLSASTKIPGTDPQYIPTSVEIHGYAGSTAETYANTHGHKFVKLPEPALYSGTCGQNLTWKLTASGLLTISGSGAMTNYTVETGATPAPWYAYRESIVEIVIEDGVTEIGNYAFNGCVSVVKATMTDSITKIRGYAFRGCHKLASVYLSKNTESIGTFAFVNNKLLDNLVIPAKVATMGTGAFQNCYALKNLTIEEGVGALGNDVFYNCTSLKEVTLPKSITKVGSERGAFRGCSALEKIVFLSTTTTIPDNAEAIPSTATIYGYTDSTADSYATKYERNRVITPLPTTVDGFCGADGDGSSVKWIFDTATGELVIEGSGAIADYTANTPSPWNEYKDEIISIDIKDGITTIGKYAFNAHAVKSVTMADSVTSIRGYAFRSCSSLINLKLSKNIETIGEFAFNGASALTSLTLPGTITSIGSHTFQNCTALSELIIEEGLTSIYNGAFAKCESLKRVVIPSSVTRVGDTKGAFYECKNLEEIIFLSPYTLIPDNQEAIPSSARIYGFYTSTAKNYADKYSRDISAFADFCDGGITVFELDGVEVKANKGEYVSIASITCMNEKTFPSVSLLFANDNGELCVRTTDNAYVPLHSRTGEVLILSDGAKLTVIYDDTTGGARYYFNQNTAVASDENQTLEFQIADQKFIDIDAYAVNIELADKVTLSSSYSVSHKAPKFLGFQVHDIDDTKIRVIAGVDMLYYTNVGFEISLYSNGVLQKNTMLDSSYVFSSVVANDKELTAESLGVKYLSAIAINDIDCKKFSKDSNIHLTIKPYATVGQEKIYGEERKIMIFYNTDTNRNSYESDDEKIDLNGKKVLFIGNSQLYFGLTVFKKDAKSVTSQAARVNDHGYFYQLCKENGFDVSVTNWTYGGHALYDLVDKPCTREDCEGRVHINDMVDPVFDYVFISCTSGKASEESFFDDIEFYVNYFKAANPAVKIVCLGNLLVRGYSTSGDDLPGIYNNYKTLEDQGIIIADWGSMVYDVIHGNASVPSATQEFNMNTFIVKDKKHPNPLVGYITALTAYCSITGESPIGQPYKFCFDPAVNEQFDMDAYEGSNYTATWTSNFRSVFESEIDMAGIQQLIYDYLEAKPYRNYQSDRES